MTLTGVAPTPLTVATQHRNRIDHAQPPVRTLIRLGQSYDPTSDTAHVLRSARDHLVEATRTSAWYTAQRRADPTGELVTLVNDLDDLDVTDPSAPEQWGALVSGLCVVADAHLQEMP